MDLLVPTSFEELAAALRDSTGTVAVRGAGTKRWGPVGESTDVVIDTSSLNAVVEHSYGDLVLTVQCGARLRDLQATVGQHGQWLALDPPEADGTVGGTLAAAASGPRRLRFGTPRDLVLGVTVVLADGTVARSGGKVVKNVAGYDLGKLFTGSYGTLGVIAQATLRLHPVPVARRVVSVDTERPWPLVREVLRSTATPTAIEWRDDRLTVVVESSEAAVDAQAATVAGVLGGAVGDRLPERLGARPWSDDDSGSDDLGLKVTFRLSALDVVIAAVRALDPAARLTAHAGSGVLWAACGPDPQLADTLREQLTPYDGSVVAVHVPVQLSGQLDVWGPVHGLGVMRRIKEQFDPEHRMNPGRFVGGI
jgi:glycolate oxidase FAD binding subunit